MLGEGRIAGEGCLKPLHELLQRKADDLAVCAQLDQVHVALSALVVADARVGRFQPLGQHFLGQPCFQSHLTQGFLKLPLLGRVDTLAHTADYRDWLLIVWKSDIDKCLKFRYSQGKFIAAGRMSMSALRCPQCGRAYSYDRRKVGYGLICATPGCQTIIPVKPPVSRRLVACALGVCAALGVGYAFGQTSARSVVPALVSHVAVAPQATLGMRKGAAAAHGKRQAAKAASGSVPSSFYIPTRAEVRAADRAWPRAHPVPIKPAEFAVEPAPAASIPFVSLPTGTDIISPLGTEGRGELTIVNGTQQDAVVKLALTESDGGQTLTCRKVYIQAGQQWTMKGIEQGMYWLYFAQGEDWNQAARMFRRNDTYSQFQKPLTYTVTTTNEGDSIRTRFHAFTVTLNAVVGGTARTNQVSKAAFDALH